MPQALSQNVDGLSASADTAENRIGHYRTTQETTLLACLTGHFSLSQAEAERLIVIGAIYVDRRRVQSDQVLASGQYVRAHFKPKRFPTRDIDWKSTIVHREPEFIVVNKPPGVPVHATLDNQVENVLHQLIVSLGENLYITQRLDGEVGGLMVFARTAAFQTQFNWLLVDRKVRKRYRALVTAPPAVGRHVHFMEPTKRSPKSVVSESRPKWLECALRVVTVEPVGQRLNGHDGFEVEIDLETGRTHRIRVQLAALGSPIVGDIMYGSRSPFALDGDVRSGIALFSASISWTGPDGREWAFTASPWSR